MVQKIFDILPPKKAEKKERLIAQIEKETKEKKFFPQLSLKKRGLILILLLFLLLVTSVSFQFSKAKIKIWPEMETVSFQTKISLNKGVQNIDFENKILPGKIFEVEKIFTEEFPATGKTPKNAEGKIRLYNSFTTQDETWLKGTRFVSTEGKLFLSKDKISVPGAVVKDGKMIPSYVDVEVIAAEPGADYNIGPSKFSVFVFRGTPRYEKYYGESSQPMTGGGQAPQVKKEDLENAEKILTEKAKNEIIEALIGKIPLEFIFLKEASEVKILEKFPLAKEGQEVERFQFQVKAKAFTLSFRKEDLDNFVLQYILEQIPEEKEVSRDSLKINYSPIGLDLQSQKTSLSLDFSAKIYPKIDINLVKETLTGKSLEEAKTFLEQQPEILRIEAKFFPFWVKKIPSEIERIEIEYPILTES